MLLKNINDNNIGVITALSQSIGQVLELVTNNTDGLNDKELSSVAMLLELDSDLKSKIHNNCGDANKIGHLGSHNIKDADFVLEVKLSGDKLNAK